MCFFNLHFKLNLEWYRTRCGYQCQTSWASRNPIFEYQLSWNLINAYQELNFFIFKNFYLPLGCWTNLVLSVTFVNPQNLCGLDHQVISFQLKLSSGTISNWPQCRWILNCKYSENLKVSLTYQPTNLQTGVGATDATASNNFRI